MKQASTNPQGNCVNPTGKYDDQKSNCINPMVDAMIHFSNMCTYRLTESDKHLPDESSKNVIKKLLNDYKMDINELREGRPYSSRYDSHTYCCPLSWCLEHNNFDNIMIYVNDDLFKKPMSGPNNIMILFSLFNNNNIEKEQKQ